MNLQDALNNKEILKNKKNITILTKEIVDDFFNKNPNAKTFIIPDSVTKIDGAALLKKLADETDGNFAKIKIL